MALEIVSIEDLILDDEHNKVCIRYEEDDYLKLKKTRIFKSTFDSIGLKSAVLSSCSINNSTFKNCYLRYAKFNNIDFTGTKFDNCDLLNAEFNSCNIRYVKFMNCQLNLKQIMGCLPHETNLKIALLKELRMNQLSIGDNKSADEILIKIHDIEKLLLLDRIKCETSYHKKREDFFSRINACFKYILLSLNDTVWGYGLRLSRLFRTGLVTIAFMALIIFFFTDKEYMTMTLAGTQLVKLDFWQSFYVSYTNFINIGYGNYIPVTKKTTIIFGIENLLGFIYLGFLVSGVYRRIAK